jgi:hypothetical protein
MKNKNLILIILFVALIIIILIIVHICSFLPAAPVSDRKEFVTDKIDHTNHDSKKDVPHDEDNKPTPTPQDNIKTASPTPQEEKQPVKEAIKAKQIKADIWIGLSDHESEGVWKWITGEKRTFTYWDAMQPDNWEGPPGHEDYRGEDYVFIRQPPRAKLPYHWNDALKDSSTLFILEREPK